MTDEPTLPANDVNDLVVETIRLSLEDQWRLVDLLLNPPLPAPAMLRAAEAHRRLITQRLVRRA